MDSTEAGKPAATATLPPKATQALNRIQRWIEADYSEDAGRDPSVFVIDAAAVSALSDLPLSSASTVFVPESAKESMPETPAEVYGYDGEFDPLGGEIGLEGAAPVQFESYAAAEYVPFTSPTVLTLMEPSDFDILRSDMESARDSGEFPAYVCHPLVSLLDGHPIETGREPSGRPRRLLLDEDRALRTTWDADRLEAGAEQSDYSYVGRAAAAFFAAELTGWCRRFLFVAHALRRLAPRLNQFNPADITVWGFGSGPELDLEVDAELSAEAVTAPLIVASGDDRLVVVPETGAVSRVPEAVATAVYADTVGAPVPPHALEAMGVAPDRAGSLRDRLRRELRI